MAPANTSYVIILITWIFLLWLCPGRTDGQDAKLYESGEFEKIDFTSKSEEENQAIIEAQLAYYKQKKEWNRYVDVLNARTSHYYYSRDYQRFMENAEFAFEEAVKKLSPNDRAVGIAWGNRALCKEIMGDFAASIRLQKEALRRFRNAPEMAFWYEGLGFTYYIIGDYDESIKNHQRAIATARIFQPCQKLYHTILRNNQCLAECYLAKNQHETAYRYLMESLEYLKDFPEVPFFLQNRWYAYMSLGNLFLQTEQMDSALYYSQKANFLLDKTNRIEAYKSYTTHGDVLLKNKDYDGAIDAYYRALSLATEEFGEVPLHESFGICYSRLGNAYIEKGDAATALEIFQQSFAHMAPTFQPNRFSDNPTTEQFINKKMGLTVLKGKIQALYNSYRNDEVTLDYLKAAYQTSMAAAALVRSTRIDYFSDGSKHLLAEKALPIYEQGIGICLELFQLTRDSLYLEEAFTLSENNKAMLFFESLRKDMAKGVAGIPDSLLEKESSLRAQYNYYQKRLQETGQKNALADADEIRSYKVKVFELGERLYDLSQHFEKHYPVYYEWTYKNPCLPVSEIRRAWPDDQTALVEYMIGEKACYLFLLTKDKLWVHEIADKAGLSEQVYRLREILSYSPNSDLFAEDHLEFTELAHQLYNQLLAEGLQDLPHSITRLHIVPDDFLCYLPFEVLLREKPSVKHPTYSAMSLDYLMEDYLLSYHYSASLLSTEQHRGDKRQKLQPFIGFAPQFEGGYARTRSCHDERLMSLLCSEEEVNTIGELMSGQAMIASQANLKDFMEAAPRHRILHLATHACIDDSGQGLNRIYLSDGDLTQYELNNLRLNAELTVLSACNTAMGRLQKGEGVMSLTRNFLLSGSRSVLTSLWAVDDCVTSTLMVEYYRALKKGYAKDEALQRAKLAYLDQSDRYLRHPNFWAGFVQFGEVDAIGSDPQWKWWWAGGGLLLLVLAGYGWRKMA